MIADETVDELFGQVKSQAAAKRSLSRDHFSVDGTVVEASGSLKRFVARASKRGAGPDDEGRGGRNREVDFPGEKRSNETHVSETDRDSRLYRKGPGKEARPYYLGPLMTENRHGLSAAATRPM